MVMVIKSNVPANTIANPDGWNPPFNTAGMLYAGIYGRGGLAKNFVPGGADAIVSGAPVVNNHFATFDLNNFIETGVKTTKATTLIAIARRVNPTKRQYLISSYISGDNAGRSLVVDVGNPNIAMYSHYKDTATAASTVFSVSALMGVTDGTPAFLYARDTGKEATVWSMTSQAGAKKTATGTLESFANPAQTYRIGRSNSGEVPEAATIAAALIFDRALPDAEIQAIYDYFKPYFSRRLIQI